MGAEDTKKKYKTILWALGFQFGANVCFCFRALCFVSATFPTLSQDSPRMTMGFVCKSDYLHILLDFHPMGRTKFPNSYKAVLVFDFG